MGDFQTVTAAFSVFHLATVCVGLIKKAAAAQAETKVWRKKIEKVQGVSQNISIALKRRKDANLPPFPSDIEARIFKSVDECRQSLEIMTKKLGPIHRSSEQSLRHTIPQAVRYLFTKDEILVQEKAIGDHHSEISLSLTLILCHDQTAIYEQGKATRQDISSIRELLEIVLRVQALDVRGLSPPSSEQSEIQDRSASSTGNPSSHSQASDDDEDDDAVSIDELRTQYPARLPDNPGQSLEPAENLLLAAVKRDKLHDVRRLLDRPEYTDALRAVDLDDWTVLHHAARRNDPSMLRVLLDAGLKDEINFLNRKSRQGHTALMGVARHAGTPQAIEMAQLLLDAQCDVNVKDDSGQTALGCAIEDPPIVPESEELVQLLLRGDRGANVMLVAPYMNDNARRRWPEIDEQIRRQGNSQ